MSVVYNGIHSVTFIESSQSITAGQTLTSFDSVRNTWNSFHLVPANRPYVSPKEPKIQMVSDTVSSKVFDITDAVAGGMTYSARKGSWDFIVDHDKWSNWYTAKQTIEDYLNGKRRYCYLNGDDTLLYYGRFKVSGWEDGTQYSKLTIEYDLDYEIYALSANLNRPTSLSASWKSTQPTVYEHQAKDSIREYLNAIVSYGGYYSGDADLDVIEGSFSGTGSQTITVSYTANDLSTFEMVKLTSSVSVNVSADYITSISVTVDPDAEFHYGDPKDNIRQHSTITCYYVSGSYVTKIAGTNANTISGTFENGDNNVTITYSGKNTTVLIHVVYLISISVNIDPDADVEFHYGDPKDNIRQYCTITCYYSNGITSTISGTNADVISGTIDNYGEYSIPLTYSGKTASVTINIPPENTWECLDYAIDHDLYKQWFNIGDEFPLTITDEYDGYAQIVDFDVDVDEYYDTIPVTFFTKNLLNTDRNMNSTNTNVGGYPASELKTYIDSLKTKLPSRLQNMLISSHKATYIYSDGNLQTHFNNFEIWLPSAREVGHYRYHERSGPVYSSYRAPYEQGFDLFSGRIKYKIGDSSAKNWWLRSSDDDERHFEMVWRDGSIMSTSANYPRSIILGFCVSSQSNKKYDTWEDINYYIRNGAYRTRYKIGDLIRLEIGQNGSEYKGYAEIVAIDTDVDANGNTIPLTFITKGLLNTDHVMNSTATNAGGYPASEMRTYIDGLKSSLPVKLQAMIVAASKSCRDRYNDVSYDISTNLELWIPSIREISERRDFAAETTGPSYSSLFNNNDKRIKYKLGDDIIASSWWTRTGYAVATDFYCIRNTGEDNYVPNANTTHGIALGFCVTSYDTWQDVEECIRNGTYSTKYKVGDLIPLQIGQDGSEYDGLAEIVAIDTDVDANGNTIPLTFITKNLLQTDHNMNSSSTNTGGYPASAMRTYIDGLKSRLPATLKSMIVAASKTSRDYNGGTPRDLTNNLELWIPSCREIFGTFETSGPIYNMIYKDATSRIKSKVGGSARCWWLRSATISIDDIGCFGYVEDDGRYYNNINHGARNAYGVVLGFCVGASQS